MFLKFFCQGVQFWESYILLSLPFYLKFTPSQRFFQKYCSHILNRYIAEQLLTEIHFDLNPCERLFVNIHINSGSALISIDFIRRTWGLLWHAARLQELLDMAHFGTVETLFYTPDPSRTCWKSVVHSWVPHIK